MTDLRKYIFIFNIKIKLREITSMITMSRVLLIKTKITTHSTEKPNVRGYLPPKRRANTVYQGFTERNGCAKLGEIRSTMIGRGYMEAYIQRLNKVMTIKSKRVLGSRVAAHLLVTYMDRNVMVICIQ